jgi:cyanate permease
LYIFLAGLAVSQFGVLILSTSLGFWMIIIGNGLSGGLFGLILNVVLSRYFGRKHYGSISGKTMSFMVFFSAIGPWIFSLSNKYFEIYHMSIIICLVIAGILLLGSLAANKPVKT